MYECRAFDAITFQETSQVWNDQLNGLEGKLPRAHHQGVLDWVAKNIQQEGTHPASVQPYAILRTDQDYACAVLEVSYVRGDSSWLKLLEVHTEPKIDASVASGDVWTGELSRIAADALVNVLGLTYDDYPCNRLKVYGRTPLTIEFLEGISSNLPQLEGFGLKIYPQAGWLIFDKLPVL